jgi:hypothetical protein
MSSCVKKKKHNIYLIITYQVEYNPFTKKFKHKIDTIIIKSKNDTNAYEQGLIHYYNFVLLDRDRKSRYPDMLDSIQSVSVLNNLGVNIQFHLSKRLKDNLNTHVKKEDLEFFELVKKHPVPINDLILDTIK